MARRSVAHRLFPALAILPGAALATALPLAAQPEVSPTLGIEWTVQPPFEKDGEARRNISGAACASARRPFCLVVNDEKKYVQAFTLSGTRIVTADVQRLLPDQLGTVEFKEIDAEGVAYDAGQFYVVGSHGVGRKSGVANESAFFVFRIPFDEQAGQPPFTFSDDQVARPIRRSDRLRQAIAQTPPLAQHAERRLDLNGANIEGIAVRDGRMYLGFRGPVIDGEAFIMSVAADAVFGEANLDAQVHPVALGERIGIRDLAAIEGGILILSGPVADTPAAPSLYLWNEASGDLAHIAGLIEPADRKAEGLLVLAQDPEFLRILVFFDGVPNGGPLEYFVPR
jgi:hypothetical protein